MTHTMKKIIIPVLLAAIFSFSAHTQVAINESGSNPHSSAIFDVQSTNKGMLIPRMNTEQRDNIQEPETGLFIFNTETNCIEFYGGSSQGWVNMCRSESPDPEMIQIPVGDNIMDEASGGTRLKNFAPVVNGEKEIYIGVPDLGVGAQRNDYDLCPGMAACWGTTMDFEFGFDPVTDKIWTEVSWGTETHYVEYPGFSSQVTTFGKTYTAAEANIIDIIAVCRDPGCSVFLNNIEIDGNPVGNVVAPYHPTDPWVHYYVTNYDFGSGFVMTATLELIGSFTLGNEHSKIEINFGYDIPE
jgi:hypothetical protein